MDFATMGRVDPVGTIQGWQNNESILKTQQQNRAVTDLNMQAKQQEIESTQRQVDAKVEQGKEQMKEVPWEILTTGFETGEGSPGALLTETAKKAGLIDMSTGVPTMNAKRKKELAKIMAQPSMIAKLNRTTVNHSKSQFDKAKADLEKKPNDPNAQAAFQKASTYYTQSVNNTKIFDEKMKKAKDSYTKSRKEYEFLNSAEKKYISQGMSEPDAKKQALTDLKSVDKAGKYAPKSAVVQNFGDIKEQVKNKAVAGDYATWTGAGATEKAMKIAKDNIGEDWADMEQGEKKIAVRTILNKKIQAVEPKAKFGVDNNIYGWYVEKDGGYELIQRWDE